MSFCGAWADLASSRGMMWGGRAKLKEWLGIKVPLDYAGVGRTVARWHPYGGLIYFHLLLKNLRAKGFLPAERQEVPV